MAKNDVLIKELMAKVEEQTKALGAKPKASWSTNGIFKYSDPTNYFNINVVSDPTVFASALGFLVMYKEHYDRGCNMLCLFESDVYTWNGYTVDQWKEDFNTRISIIQYDKKKKVLDATKVKLNGLVSEEAKTEMALEEIAKLLK